MEVKLIFESFYNQLMFNVSISIRDVRSIMTILSSNNVTGPIKIVSF